jgi:hypothetical protein
MESITYKELCDLHSSPGTVKNDLNKQLRYWINANKNSYRWKATTWKTEMAEYY